jgi:hypothetical protein
VLNALCCTRRAKRAVQNARRTRRAERTEEESDPMSDQPGHDDANNITRPIWSSAQQGEPGDYVTLGGPPRSPARSRHLAIGAVVAVVAMLGGAGAAYAVNTSGSPQRTVAASSPKSHSPKPVPWKCPRRVMCHRMRAPFPFHRGDFLPELPFVPGLIGGMLGAVHGQMVVAKPGGGYQTVDVQRGKVTAVNSSSITVHSADGFSATYAVAGATLVGAQRAGIGSVKVGDQVSLQATVSGSKATATSIIDLTLLMKSHKSIGHWNFSAG